MGRNGTQRKTVLSTGMNIHDLVNSLKLVTSQVDEKVALVFCYQLAFVKLHFKALFGKCA